MRTFAITIALLALAGPAFSAEKVEMTQSNLAKATALSQVAGEAEKARAGVDGAARIGLIVESAGPGNPNPRTRGTIVVQSTDPEWAAVVAAVKSLAARRKTAADAELEVLGVKVLPDDVAPVEAAPEAAAAPEAPAAPVAPAKPADPAKPTGPKP